MGAIPEVPGPWLRERLTKGAQLASELDSMDTLAHFRDEFEVPTMASLSSYQDDAEVKAGLRAGGDRRTIYLTGNSLGAMPKGVREWVNRDLDQWSHAAMEGQFTGSSPWLKADEVPIAKMAHIVGAKTSEVAVMNTLSVNLHFLLCIFYAPEGKRTKIMYEHNAFPSDYLTFESHAKLNKLKPEDVLCPVKPREGEKTLRTEDIINAMTDEFAVVCFSGIQYLTGQYFDIKAITAAAHKKGIKALWDCAHAAGNVDLQLHDWEVDGAVWCNYKYLNGGAGTIGSFYIHEKYHKDDTERIQGWWGHEQSTRFQMNHVYRPEHGARGFQMSNPPTLQMAAVNASLEIFSKTTMKELRRKSIILTSYLEELINHRFPNHETFEICTPSDIHARGAQLSLYFHGSESKCCEMRRLLLMRGVVLDYRRPNILRAAPTPLYTSFTEVFNFVELLYEVVDFATEEFSPRSKRLRAN